MAFSVSPTSGANPYTLSISFLNKSSFGLGYSFTVAQATASSSCPAVALNQSALIRDALLENGVYVVTTSVANGSCQTFTARILNPAGEVIETQSINVSNIV